MMTETPILQTVNLRKYYRQGDHVTKALDGVSLSVDAGEFVAVVGTSGSGKSTLLHMLGGLDTPTSGDIIVGGKRLSKKSEEQMAVFRRRHIGFVFQNYNLVPILNVYENIVLPVQLDGRKADKDFLEEIVCSLGLQDKLQSLPNNLSGGQQQRVSIARALAKNPKIVLCDEPTGALDYATGKAVLALLQDTCRQTGKTVIVITHNQALTQMADRVIKVKNGKAVQCSLNPSPIPVEQIEW